MIDDDDDNDDNDAFTLSAAKGRYGSNDLYRN
jgi:hypothetical protein